MPYFNPHWLEAERKRWLRHDAHRFVRPDGKRWLPPEQWQAIFPDEAPRAPDRKDSTRDWLAAEAEAEYAAAFREAMLELRVELAWMRVAESFAHLAAFVESFAHLAAKAGFNPDQPRIPAGQSGGGQWTSGGGGAVRLAGDIPTGEPPKVPQQRPQTARERNNIARALARRYGGRIGLILDAASWLIEQNAVISSYVDPPKSLEELQQAASTPAPGYDIHHIVEQSSAAQDGFSSDQIDSPDNLVSVPRWKHWEINGWYGAANDEYGGLSPRDYLRGRDWEERRRIGIEALIKAGVLKK